MINVTKTFLPDFEEYSRILKRAWDNAWITNNGELLQELEGKLAEYLGVEHLLFCSNGTVVLQLALKALQVSGEVITTPFSYVATTNALIWEGCTPVYVDINERDFCIDVSKIEAAITADTSAILATHVYGNPCDVDAIASLAAKYRLKVIYDGAHAFGVHYKDKPLLGQGDVSTCSFHATKIFHTVEGGCLATNDAELAGELKLIRSFGHVGDEYYRAGINGKNSEFHAAMGLANLPHLPEIFDSRRRSSQLYDSLLQDLPLGRPIPLENTKCNHSYYPVLFRDESTLLNVISALKDKDIMPRRYFYPSLNNLPYLPLNASCPVSEDVAERVLCLPLFHGLQSADQSLICDIIKNHC
jgi:dTDP-4-amino-4,6-dideoxygalactose transaminase